MMFPLPRAVKLLVLSSLLIVPAAAWITFAAAGDSLVESIYDGESSAYLNQRLAIHRMRAPAERDLQYYQEVTRGIFYRFFAFYLAGHLLLTAIVFSSRLQDVLRRFFSATTAPLNLAVFRIAHFLMVAQIALTWDARALAERPAELIVPPIGLGFLSEILWIVPASQPYTQPLLALFAVLAMVGWRTRFSAWTTTALATVVLLTPQLYGKVDHLHHIVWFSAVLASSRCGDALSFDAAIAGLRSSGRGVPEPAPRSRAYALPIRVTWILLGLLYFFPGYGKVTISGIEWALSDNLRYRLFDHWYDLRWTPAFRLDHYPDLVQLLALGTLVFELGFIFAIFFRRSRIVAALMGLGFHSSIYYLMRISFWSLVRAYVTFVDWDRGLRWLGRKVHRGELTLRFDDADAPQRRIVAALQSLELFSRTRYVADARASRVELDLRGRTLLGWRRWVTLLVYHPLAWVVPIARLLALVPTAGVESRRTPASGGEGSSRPLRVTAAVLIVCNFAFGITMTSWGWPFACYPLFAAVFTAPERPIMSIEAVQRGEARELLGRSAGEAPERTETGAPPIARTANYVGLERQILTTPSRERQQQLLGGLSERIRGRLAEVRDADLCYYRIVVSTVPEEWQSPPLERTLIYCDPPASEPSGETATVAEPV